MIINEVNGDNYVIALRSDGTVVVWGSKMNAPNELRNIVQIAAMNDFGIALDKFGRVMCWTKLEKKSLKILIIK